MALDTIQIVRGFRYLGLSFEVAESITDAESMPDLDLQTLSTETNDQLVAMVLDVSQLKGYVMHSDQAITLETNSAEAADDTITFAANQCRIWSAADENAQSVFTTDVTAFYISVAGTVVPRIRMWFPLDPTA